MDCRPGRPPAVSLEALTSRHDGGKNGEKSGCCACAWHKDQLSPGTSFVTTVALAVSARPNPTARILDRGVRGGGG